MYCGVVDDSAKVKRCTKCGEVKPLEDFYLHEQNGRGRRRPDCRACVAERSRQRYAVTRERKLETNREWRKAHPDKMREYVTDFRARDAQHVRDLANAGRQRLRAKVFDHYGWLCACCGTDQDPSIDHVHGGGNQHRLDQFGMRENCVAVWRWLVKNDFPAGFQTLCIPCNTSKASGDYCRLDHVAQEVQ